MEDIIQIYIHIIHYAESMLLFLIGAWAVSDDIILGEYAIIILVESPSSVNRYNDLTFTMKTIFLLVYCCRCWYCYYNLAGRAKREGSGNRTERKNQTPNKRQNKSTVRFHVLSFCTCMHVRV